MIQGLKFGKIRGFCSLDFFSLPKSETWSDRNLKVFHEDTTPPLLHRKYIKEDVFNTKDDVFKLPIPRTRPKMIPIRNKVWDVYIHLVDFIGKSQ